MRFEKKYCYTECNDENSLKRSPLVLIHFRRCDFHVWMHPETPFLRSSLRPVLNELECRRWITNACILVRETKRSMLEPSLDCWKAGSHCDARYNEGGVAWQIIIMELSRAFDLGLTFLFNILNISRQTRCTDDFDVLAVYDIWVNIKLRSEFRQSFTSLTFSSLVDIEGGGQILSRRPTSSGRPWTSCVTS